MVHPEHWKVTCLACKETVTFATGFKCKMSPYGHRVASKRYYHMGGRDLQHPHEKMNWAPTLMYARPKEIGNDGMLRDIPPREVQFGQRGLLDTEDAEIQFLLETNSRAVGLGEEGRKAWEHHYLTPQAQEAVARQRNAELEAQNQKLREENTLLEQQKARRGGGSSAAASNPAASNDDIVDQVLGRITRSRV